MTLECALYCAFLLYLVLVHSKLMSVRMTSSLFARYRESSVDGFRDNRVDVYKLCFIYTKQRSERPVDSLVPI